MQQKQMTEQTNAEEHHSKNKQYTEVCEKASTNHGRTG